MQASQPNQPLPRFVLLAAVGVMAVGVGLFAPNLFAITPPPGVEQRPSAPPAVDGAAAELALLVGLVTVAGVGVAGYLTHKHRPAEPEMLGRLTVDAGGVVHLVQMADRRLLLGVDPDGVNAVAELPAADPQEAASASVPNDVSVLFARLRVI